MTKEWRVGDKLDSISLPLTLRRAIQAVAGTRDYYPFHHDEQYSKEHGAETIFFNTMFLQGFVGRCVNEWFGYDAFLRKLDIAMRRSNYINRTLVAEGTVTGIRQVNGCKLVDAEVILSTEDGPTTSVKFTVQLPISVTP